MKQRRGLEAMILSTTDRLRRSLRNMLALVAIVCLSACTQNEPPPPAFSVSKPHFPTCMSRLTEGACKEGRGCRWMNEHKRADGTLATARCTGR
jgi:hypothetical protein